MKRPRMLVLFAGVAGSPDLLSGNSGTDIKARASKVWTASARGLNQVPARKSFRSSRIGY
jgi:hypothetical protein